MPKVRSKQRPTPGPAKSRRAPAGLSAETSPDYAQHHDTLVGLVDPFSKDAGQTKIPDLGASRTYSEQIRFVSALSSDANGNAYFVVVPKTNYPFLINNVNVWAAAYLLSSPSLCASDGQAFRVTSMGVRITSLLAATTSSGTLALATGPAPLLAGVVQVSPDYYYEYQLDAVGDESEWHLIGKPTGNESLEWNDISSYSTAAQSPIEGWTSLYCIGQGLPVSTSVFRVEIVLNVEFTFTPLSPLAKLATQQPVYNPQLLVARNELQNRVMHSVKGAKDKLAQHVKKEAHQAIRKHVLPFLKKKGLKMLAGAALL